MISIVVPAYNEVESLAGLHAELSAVAGRNGYDLEIILVDDGSTDGSWEVIRRLAAEDPRVRGIRLRRNFGKAAALSAGFREAQGEVIFTLDADQQDDPNEIPRILAKLNEGFDVVSGWKEVRHDPWHKVYPSRVFNWLVGRATGVQLHDHNCGMKCYRRQVLAEVRLYGEMHRFVPVLAAARGFRIGEIAVKHRPRQHGQSKYGAWRVVKGFLDLLTVVFLTGFGQRPQHMLGSAGLVSLLLGGLGMTYLSLMWVITRILPVHAFEVHQTAMIYYSLGAILLGAQLISIGFLAELITYTSGRHIDTYSIVESTPRQPRENLAADALTAMVVGTKDAPASANEDVA